MTKNTSHGSASFTTLGQACRRGLWTNRPASFLLGDWHGADLATGYAALPVGWLQRQINLPVYAQIEANVLTIGPPRSGKGAGSIVVNALRWDRFILYEPNGESAAVVLKHLREAGYYTAVVNPGGLHREEPYLTPSHGFNVISMLEPGDPKFGSQCFWLGGLLVERTGNEHDPFWVNKPEGVASVLVMFLRVSEPPERQNLAVFRDWIMADNDGWKDLVQRMKDWCGQFDSKQRYGELTSVILNRANELSRELALKDNRTWASVVSSLESFTRWLDIPDVRECVQKSEIDFERFKSADKAALLFMVDGNFARTHSGFGRMFVAATIMAMRRKPLAKSRALMVLDEFVTLHYPDIETELATMPKERLSVQVVLQSVSQVKDIAKIEQACEVRQYLAANDLQTARHISDHCGVTTVATQTISGGKVTTHYTQRLLMTPDEVLTLHGDKQIVFVRKSKPMILRLRPYWQRPVLRGKYYPNPWHRDKEPRLRPYWPLEIAAGIAFRVASWVLGPSKTVALLALLLAAAVVLDAGVLTDQSQGQCLYQKLSGPQWWDFHGRKCGLVKIGERFYG